MDTVARQLDLTTHALVVFLLPPTAVVALAARPILRLVYGPGYDNAADVLAVLIAATYLSVVPIPSVTSLSGTKRRWFKVPAWSSVLGLGIGLVGWLTLGPRYGTIGIAWGYLIGSVPQSAIPMGFAARVLGVRFGWLALKATAAWGAVLGLALTMKPTEPGAGGDRIAAAIGVALIVYLVLFARDLRTALADAAERISRRRAATR
jgi:O-antigen/teichoic acid export membrane protein